MTYEVPSGTLKPLLTHFREENIGEETKKHRRKGKGRDFASVLLRFFCVSR